MDDGFYSADYLRAWIRSAQLRAHLREKVGPQWWEMAETGELLRGLFFEGTRPSARKSLPASGSSRSTRARSCGKACLPRRPHFEGCACCLRAFRPIKTAMDDESGIVESERLRRSSVTNINIFALAPVAASHATPVRAPEIEPAETSETLVSPQWLERRNKKLDLLEQELRRRAAELDLREAELEQREAEFEAEAFIRSEPWKSGSNASRSSTSAWTGARTSWAPTWRGCRAIYCAPTRSKRTPGLHSSMAQAPALPRGFELPLEPRLPRIGSVDQVAVEARAASSRSGRSSARRSSWRSSSRSADGPDDARGRRTRRARSRRSARRRCGPIPPTRASRRSRRSASTRTSSRSRSSALAGTGVKVASVATAFPSGQSPLDVEARARSRGVVELGARRDRHGDRPRRVPLGPLREGLRRGRAGEGGLRRGAPEGDPRDRRARDVRQRAPRVACSRWPPAPTSSRRRPGKLPRAATLPVTLVMLEAIRDVYEETGRRVGMKPAGGIRQAKQAIQYLVVSARDARARLADARPVPPRRLVASERHAHADPQGDAPAPTRARTTSPLTGSRARIRHDEARRESRSALKLQPHPQGVGGRGRAVPHAERTCPDD